MVFRFLKKLLSTSMSERVRPPIEIVATNEGLRLTEGDAEHWKLRWNEVEEIAAFKRDRLTTDLLCFQFKKIGEGLFFEVNEDMIGFLELEKMVKEVFPSSDQDWRLRVIKPAFDPNHTVIYEKPQNK